MALKNNLLTITVLDMASLEPLKDRSTHTFFVCINATAYMVTRSSNNGYEVIAHESSASATDKSVCSEPPYWTMHCGISPERARAIIQKTAQRRGSLPYRNSWV